MNIQRKEIFLASPWLRRYKDFDTHLIIIDVNMNNYHDNHMWQQSITYVTIDGNNDNKRMSTEQFPLCTQADLF